MVGRGSSREAERAAAEAGEPRWVELLAVRGSALFRFWLGLLALALGFVGLGVAFRLTESLWAAPLGFLLGVSVALGLARDFLRWRLSPVSLASALVFLLLFVAAQARTGPS